MLQIQNTTDSYASSGGKNTWSVTCSSQYFRKTMICLVTRCQLWSPKLHLPGFFPVETLIFSYNYKVSIVSYFEKCKYTFAYSFSIQRWFIPEALISAEFENGGFYISVLLYHYSIFISLVGISFLKVVYFLYKILN